MYDNNGGRCPHDNYAIVDGRRICLDCHEEEEIDPNESRND